MTDTTNYSLLHEEKSRQTNGWTPLVYPASALCDSPEANPCFPLERNVLRAAVRELLILDKSMDSTTLELSSEMAKFQDGSTGPVYLGHVDANRWKVPAAAESKKSSRAGKKRSLPRSSSKAPVVRKKPKRKVRKVQNSPAVEEGGTCDSFHQEAKDKIPNAEALTDVIVQHAYKVSDAPCVEADKTLEQPKSLRKVSDADTDDNSTSSTLYSLDISQRLDGPRAANDISQFFNLQTKSLISEEISPFIQVSIASEIILRNLAREITLKLVESFHDGALRTFLGYKSSSLKRDRLVYVLAEYFFDVSHAMFAWKQTERELLSEGKSEMGSVGLQERIVKTLFDSRALRKIGGFDDSSLLPHALSICHLDKQGVTWKEFAKTSKGKALLQHHHDGKPLLAGQKRRGHRVRTRNVVASSDSPEAGSRSRSSSITSYDAIDSKRDAATSDSSRLVDAMHEELWTEERQASLQMPDILNVSLRKTASSSWGVLLSKEGDMCVVVRAPQSGNVGLKIGDVILSVGDETQASGRIVDWFRIVVNKFKSSNELDLVVRRVGSGQQAVVSDDSSRGES